MVLAPQEVNTALLKKFTFYCFFCFNSAKTVRFKSARLLKYPVHYTNGSDWPILLSDGKKLNPKFELTERSGVEVAVGVVIRTEQSSWVSGAV